jgi:ABC-type multidrug transport system fused ATPase/permease subunit
MYIIDRILWPYVLSNKFYFIIYTILSFIVYSIGSIFIPRTITEFINANQKESTGFIKILRSGSMKGLLYVLGIIFVLYTLLTYIKDQLENHLLYSFSSDSKKKTIKNIFYKYTNNYKELSESEVSWMIQNIYGTVRFIIRYIFIDFIPCFMMFLLISSYFLYYDKIIGSLFILQFIAFLFVFYYYHSELLENYSKNDTITINNNNFIGDKTKNLMNIVFDNSLQSELNDIMKKEDDLLLIMKDCFHLNNKILFINNTLFYVIFFIILYLLMKKDKKTISTILIMFLIYKGFQVNLLHNTLYQYFGYSKLIKINDFIEDINEDDTCKPIQQFKSIKLQNVSYRYDAKSDYILRNINIHFKPKEINILMGKSGSGKTTIMKLIIKMYNPTKGEIYLDETNSKDICQTDIRNNIYYVNQRTILFDESVLYNLQYGNDTKKDVIVELLNKYDLLDYYKTLEHGIDTTSGVNGSKLSLGMQKIIMVVRGILKPNKGIIIFDEPLTSLDKDTREKIVQLIVNETKGKTVIIISHDPEILPYADNIIKMN